MAEGNSDIEKELLIEEDQTNEVLSTNERFMELLSKMNDNICALDVSLNKRPHDVTEKRWAEVSQWQWKHIGRA